MNGLESQEPYLQKSSLTLWASKMEKHFKKQTNKKEIWDFFSDKSVYISGPVKKDIYCFDLF